MQWTEFSARYVVAPVLLAWNLASCRVPEEPPRVTLGSGDVVAVLPFSDETGGADAGKLTADFAQQLSERVGGRVVAPQGVAKLLEVDPAALPTQQLPQVIGALRESGQAQVLVSGRIVKCEVTSRTWIERRLVSPYHRPALDEYDLLIREEPVVTTRRSGIVEIAVEFIEVATGQTLAEYSVRGRALSQGNPPWHTSERVRRSAMERAARLAARGVARQPEPPAGD